MSFLTPEDQEYKTDILAPELLGVAIETGNLTISSLCGVYPYPHLVSINKDDVTVVCDDVIAAQRRLLKGNDLISKNPITLRITSSAVPDLTLVDLPGFVTGAQAQQQPQSPGMPPVDISKQVREERVWRKRRGGSKGRVEWWEEESERGSHVGLCV